ncbi:MAG: endonuclease III [Candidatus Latescibacteria bacterium]|nr:endonuclease III [Candidatus Latescibacterota bacterium]
MGGSLEPVSARLITTAKVQIVLDVLQRLYPNPSVPLKRRDPYTHLIAVLLSAQCTDVRVNQVTPALFARADRPERMIELAVAEIEQIIRPCGLAPRKSKAIWELSQILLAEHGGQVQRLPGVGHKTAQVVLAQNFGVPTFPVDTHIHRLIYRWGLSTGKNVEQTERDCKRLFPQERWNDLHLQIIYFGREHCPARGHQPAECLLCSRIGRKSLFK